MNDNTVEKIKFTALALEWTKQGNFGNMLADRKSVSCPMRCKYDDRAARAAMRDMYDPDMSDCS